MATLFPNFNHVLSRPLEHNLPMDRWANLIQHKVTSDFPMQFEDLQI